MMATPAISMSTPDLRTPAAAGGVAGAIGLLGSTTMRSLDMMNFGPGSAPNWMPASNGSLRAYARGGGRAALATGAAVGVPLATAYALSHVDINRGGLDGALLGAGVGAAAGVAVGGAGAGIAALYGATRRVTTALPAGAIGVGIAAGAVAGAVLGGRS